MTHPGWCGNLEQTETMTDSIEQQVQDYRRFYDGAFSRENFTGAHDYGKQNILWEKISSLYVVLMQKKGEKTGNLHLGILEADSPLVNLVSARHFDYRRLLQFVRSNEEELGLREKYGEFAEISKKEFSRETAETFFPLLVVTCIQMARKAFVDISVKDYLKRGASFVPVKKNIREIIDYRTVVEKHSTDPIYQEKEEEQEIGLKEWEKGEVIEDRYEVKDIFRGGMGVVYEILDRETSNYYATKMFQERFLWDKKITEMFLHEAQVWIELERHENIVQALFVKNYQGCPALFLEFVRGTDLEKELAKGKLDLQTAMDMAIQFCSGMTYAYEKLAIVHRDIKPSNCLIDTTGGKWVMKITDFGLVKVFEKEEDKALNPDEPEAEDEEATRGTFAYMAPECFKSEKEIDTRSDIYSFGIMFYEMLTGMRPLHGKNMMEFMKAHSQTRPMDPRKLNPEIPQELSDVVLCCLEKEPENRFLNFRELMETLQTIYEELTGAEYLTDESGAELTLEEWENKANSLAALGRHEEALFAFEKALEKSPKDAKLWHRKGDSLVALARLKEAIRCYDKAILTSHRLPGTWNSKGDVYYQLQNYELAVFCYNNALKLDPDNEIAWVKKGMYANLTGAFQEAIESGEKALQVNPRNAEGWYVKGKAYFALNQIPEALQCARKALEENPLWGKAWAFQAALYARMKFYGEAVESLEKYLELNPDNTRALQLKGMHQFRACRFNDALTTLNEVVRREPDNMEALYFKCKCHYAREEREELRRGAELILEKSPRHPGALTIKGMILETLLHLDSAEQCYETAIAAFPEDPLPLYLLDCLDKTRSLNKNALSRAQQEFEDKFKVFVEDIQLPSAEEEGEGGKIFSLLKRKKKESPEELRYAALKAFENDEYIIALNLFSRYLSINPEDAKIWEFAGDSLDKIETPEEQMRSIDCYKMAIKHSPGNLYMWNKLLTHLEHQPGKNLETLICLKQNMLLLPDNMKLKFKELAQLQKIGFTRLCRLKALGLLEILASTQVEATWTLKGKAILLSILERYNEVVPLYDSLLKKESRDSMSLAQKGDVLARLGDTQAALKCLMTASKYSPKDARIFYLMGVTYEELGDLDRAAKSYEVSLKYDEDYEMPLVRLGFCLYKKGNIKESLDYYNRVLEKNSHATRGWEAKGLVMAITGNYLEAEWCFNKALQEEGADVSVLENKALLLLRMERYGDAIKVLDETTTLDPLHYKPWTMKAECHFLLGDAEEAMNCCERAIEVDPTGAAPWVNTGLILTHAKQFEGAIDALNRAIDLDPTMPEAYLNRGVAHFLMGEQTAGLADFKIALTLDENFAIAWYNLGLCLLKEDNIDETIRCFDKAIACDSKLADAWVERGLLQISLKLYQEARRLGEKASQLDPRNHRAWFLHAHASTLLANASTSLDSGSGESDDEKLRTEAFRDALKNYEKCLRLHEDYVPALVGKIEALIFLGRKQEAQESSSKVIQLLSSQGRTELSSLEEEMDPSRIFNAPQDRPARFDFSIKPHWNLMNPDELF